MHQNKLSTNGRQNAVHVERELIEGGVGFFRNWHNHADAARDRHVNQMRIEPPAIERPDPQSVDKVAQVEVSDGHESILHPLSDKNIGLILRPHHERIICCKEFHSSHPMCLKVTRDKLEAVSGRVGEEEEGFHQISHQNPLVSDSHVEGQNKAAVAAA